MKKIVVIIAILFLNIIVNAQKFNGNFSGSIGIPNVKVRVQYEHPIGDRGSVGINSNYHFFNWKGPMVESFGRLYSKKTGNEKGFFGQFKFCYGNFTYLNTQTTINTRRFSVFGAGIGCGYKFLVAPHFTIEPYGGLRLISGPPYEDNWVGPYELIGWYAWTGLPFELHAKFGYQF